MNDLLRHIEEQRSRDDATRFAIAVIVVVFVVGVIIGLTLYKIILT